MTKRYFLSICAILVSFSSFSQLSCKVEVSLKNYSEDKVYIGYHMMGKTYVRDTLPVTAGKFILEESERIEKGLYMVINPKTLSFFEVAMGDDQKFRLDVDFNNPINGMVVTGSEDNEILYEFFQKSEFLNKRITDLDELAKKLDSTATAYKENRNERKKLNSEFASYKRQVIANYPELFVTKLIEVSLDVEFPEELSADKADNQTRFNYYRDHFLDSLDFKEEGLLRTNIIHAKIERYLTELTNQDAQSLIDAVHHICDLSKGNKEIFKAVVVYLLNKYATSKVIGMDAVYADIVEKYYMTGEAFWIDKKNLELITNNVVKLKPTLIGEKASKISGIGLNRTNFQVNTQGFDKTVVLFWNYYDKPSIDAAKEFQLIMKLLNDPAVQLISICTVGNIDSWKKSLSKNGLLEENNTRYLLNTNTEYYENNFNYKGTGHKTYLLDANSIIDFKQFNAEQIFNYLSDTEGE